MKPLLLFATLAALLPAQSNPAGDPLASLTPADLEAGGKLYRHHCALCHGFQGNGGSAPSLARPTLPRAADNIALLKLIAEGISGTAMPGTWQVSDRERLQIAGFVRGLGKLAESPVAGDPAKGEALYAKSGCAGCHVLAGRGTGIGPELTTIGLSRPAANLRESLVNAGAIVPPDYRFVRATLNDGREVRGLRVAQDVFTLQIKEQTGRFASYDRKSIKTIDVSRNKSLMPDYKHLSPTDLDDLVAYLVAQKAAPDSASSATAPNILDPVSYERIVKGELDAGQWLTYSGNYQGHRYSPLTQITKANVSQLKPVWMYQARPAGRFETTPIVADGVMYVSEPPTIVTALDARTGRRLWQYQRQMPKDLQTIGFGPTNRGVAILGDTLYVGTLDAWLVALDARSGAVRWQTKVEENKLGYSLTGAPLAFRDRVIVGVAGAEAGIRGFLDAYDARTGKRLWRRFTIPGPSEPGHESWQNDAWKTGGGSTWVTGSYDPDTNTVFWGIGNPGPDWNGDVRPGDNLYTCSLLALDASNGNIRWHFQFTPHDTHDWDSTHVPILLDGEVRGQRRKLVAVANRNAFYYVLDRGTGEFLAGAPYAKQTWAKGLDDRGRPIVIPGTDPTPEGNLVWPSLNGATVWFSPSYSPATQLFYVSVREKASVYFKGEAIYKPGTFFAGGGERNLDPDEEWGAIRALEATTGKTRWEFRLPTPPWSGVLSTAGGLVFSGSNEGNLYALDADTGNALWNFQAGGPVASNPMAFAIRGKQMVAFAAGSTLVVLGLPD